MRKILIAVILFIFFSIPFPALGLAENFHYDRWPLDNWEGRDILLGYSNRQAGVKDHFGVDIKAQEGEPVYAPISGTVYWIFDKDPHGISVGIEGSGKRLTFLHLSHRANDLKRGSPVTSGKEIGKVGSTGGSGRDCEQSHLHFGVKNIILPGASVEETLDSLKDPLLYGPVVQANLQQSQEPRKEPENVAVMLTQSPALENPVAINKPVLNTASSNQKQSVLRRKTWLSPKRTPVYTGSSITERHKTNTAMTLLKVNPIQNIIPKSKIPNSNLTIFKYPQVVKESSLADFSYTQPSIRFNYWLTSIAGSLFVVFAVYLLIYKWPNRRILKNYLLFFVRVLAFY